MEFVKEMSVGGVYAVTQIDILPDGQMVGNFNKMAFTNGCLDILRYKGRIKKG